LVFAIRSEVQETFSKKEKAPSIKDPVVHLTVGMGYVCFIPLSGVFGAKNSSFFFTSTHFLNGKSKG